MGNQNQSFWSSLPGILTGIATVITAITGLYIAIAGNSVEKDSVAVVETNQQEAHKPSTEQPSVESAQTEITIPAGIVSVTQPKVTGPKVINPKATTLKEATPKEIVPKTIQPEITLPKTVLSQSATLVDCEYFPSVNSIRSLMSWSNHYQQQIVDANGVTARALSSCKKTISYRAQAYCQTPQDREVKQALFETLSLCEAAGIDWTSAVKQD